MCFIILFQAYFVNFCLFLMWYRADGVVVLSKVYFNFDFNFHLKSTSLSLHTFFSMGGRYVTELKLHNAACRVMLHDKQLECTR